MSPAKERKNRFQVSREVQEEFVNGIAETMLSLAEKAGKWQQGWTSDTPVGMPFCPVTGREYSGANMVRLLLASIARGYADDRWMTFRQPDPSGSSSRIEDEYSQGRAWRQGSAP